VERGIPEIRRWLRPHGERIEYTYYFGRVVGLCPAVVTVYGGVVWGAAVAHVFRAPPPVPRQAIARPDIANTERYTGMNLTLQAHRRSEIPMGYMAESYVDFGPILMFRLRYSFRPDVWRPVSLSGEPAAF